MDRYRLFSLLGIIATLGILAWVSKSDNLLEVPIFQGDKSPTDSDFMMDNFISRQYNASGDLHYELSAKRLTHYPHNKTALLESPLVNFYNDQASPWIAKSHSGLLREEDASLILNGQVSISQDPLPLDSQPWLIESEALTLYPRENIILTAYPVSIASGHQYISAIGLHANTKTHKIKLLHEVKGQHAPNRLR